jgi:hypothetical protein
VVQITCKDGENSIVGSGAIFFLQGQRFGLTAASNGGYFDWKLVRHIPANCIGWDPEKDPLSGKEAYGNPTDNSSAWAVKFDEIYFDKYKIESVDKSYIIEYSKEVL